MVNPPARAESHWDAGETLAERFRAHARDAEHLYGYAIRGMADDWDAGGPSARCVADMSVHRAGQWSTFGCWPAYSVSSSPAGLRNSCGSIHVSAALRPRRKSGRSCVS